MTNVAHELARLTAFLHAGIAAAVVYAEGGEAVVWTAADPPGVWWLVQAESVTRMEADGRVVWATEYRRGEVVRKIPVERS